MIHLEIKETAHKLSLTPNISTFTKASKTKKLTQILKTAGKMRTL